MLFSALPRQQPFSDQCTVISLLEFSRKTKESKLTRKRLSSVLTSRMLHLQIYLVVSFQLLSSRLQEGLSAIESTNNVTILTTSTSIAYFQPKWEETWQINYPTSKGTPLSSAIISGTCMWNIWHCLLTTTDVFYLCGNSLNRKFTTKNNRASTMRGCTLILTESLIGQSGNLSVLHRWRK